jgi:hypothetical protein
VNPATPQHHPALPDRVRLTQALPTLWLQCGDVGVVQSVWLSSPPFYEVEFLQSGESFPVRALIPAQHLEVLSMKPMSKPAEAQRRS